MQRGWKKMAVWMATVCTVFAVANPVSVKAEVPDKVTTQTFEVKVGDEAYSKDWISQALEKTGLTEIDAERYIVSCEMNIEDENVVKVGFMTDLMDADTGEEVGPLLFIPITAGLDDQNPEFRKEEENGGNALVEKFNLNDYSELFLYEGHRVHLSSWSAGPYWMKAMKPGTTNIVIPAYPIKDGSKTIELTIPVKVVGEENAQPENNQPENNQPENTTADTSKKDEPSSTAKSPKTGETSMAVVWGIVAIAGVMLVVCKKRETK